MIEIKAGQVWRMSDGIDGLVVIDNNVYTGEVLYNVVALEDGEVRAFETVLVEFVSCELLTYNADLAHKIADTLCDYYA